MRHFDPPSVRYLRKRPPSVRSMPAGPTESAAVLLPRVAMATETSEDVLCLSSDGARDGAQSHKFCVRARLADATASGASATPAAVRSGGDPSENVRELHRRRVAGEAQRRPDVAWVGARGLENLITQEIGRRRQASRNGGAPVPVPLPRQTMFFPVDTTGLFGPEPVQSAGTSGYTHGYPEDMIPGTEAELDALDDVVDDDVVDDFGFPVGLAPLTPSAPVPADGAIRAGLLGLLNVDRFNLREFVAATQRGRRGTRSTPAQTRGSAGHGSLP